MAPAWLQRPLLTLALLLSGACYAQGPNTWLSRAYCGGKRQSPIDIIPEKTNPNHNLYNVYFSPEYEDNQKLLAIINNGNEVRIEIEDKLLIKLYDLPEYYTAKTIHFRWGNRNSKPGSEHFLDGRQYAMELQIFHTKNNKRVQVALEDSDGIVALGFFVQGHEEAKDKRAETWKALSDDLPKISTKGQITKLNGTFSLWDLVGSTENLDRYYLYHGSLTTGDCNEGVIWTIFAEPILVSPKVVAAFPKLFSTHSSSGPHLESNFRPLQKIGQRIVEVSHSLKDIVVQSASSLDTQPAKFFLLLFITLTFLFPV